jgi:DeoR/GlpR family transcriptional regulator of sugar metabolism
MLNARQSRILPLAHQRGRITNGQLAQLRRSFDVTPETIRLDLAGLVRLGLLERRGTKKGTHYVPTSGGSL